MNHHQFASEMSNLTLLYIEDDYEIQRYLAEFLKRYMGQLYLAQDAEEGKKLYDEVNPDIILLDINLPIKSGIDFARELREYDHSTRIIISTAYTDEEFLLTAIELEITRYLVKPLTSKELMEALTKSSNEICKNKIFELGEGYTYDVKRKILLKNNEIVSLRRKEIELLEYFIFNSNKIISYDELQYKIWIETPMSRDAIRAQIRNLRKKLYPKIVLNISGVGYKLSKEA